MMHVSFGLKFKYIDNSCGFLVNIYNRKNNSTL